MNDRILERSPGCQELIYIGGAMSQRSASHARAHSASSTALRARKVIPTVPNFAALPAWGAPAKTSPRQVISKPTNPAAMTVA
jgi:hypothetical protein